MPRSRIEKTAPADFTGKLVYISGLDADDYTKPLNNKLLLVSEDEASTQYVFAYVLNDSMHHRLGEILRRHNQTLSDEFNFIQVFDSLKPGFAIAQGHFLSFLMRRSPPEVNTFSVHRFGAFEAYICESWEEAKHVSNFLRTTEKIAAYSQLIVDRQTLVGLVRTGKAVWRDADPDIVFNTSGYMRAHNAFPDKVP